METRGYGSPPGPLKTSLRGFIWGFGVGKTGVERGSEGHTDPIWIEILVS